MFLCMQSASRLSLKQEDERRSQGGVHVAAEGSAEGAAYVFDTPVRQQDIGRVRDEALALLDVLGLMPAAAAAATAAPALTWRLADTSSAEFVSVILVEVTLDPAQFLQPPAAGAEPPANDGTSGRLRCRSRSSGAQRRRRRAG